MENNLTANHTGQPSAKTGKLMAYVHVFLFVGVYVGLGYALKLNGYAYLLLGVPLTIIFQLLVRKEPLHKLWIRDHEKFKLNTLGIFLAIGFAILPGWRIANMFLENKFEILEFGYLFLAFAGALGAGYAFSNLRKKTWKDLLWCLLIGGTVSIAWMGLQIWLRSLVLGEPVHFNVKEALLSLLIYIPICFTLEEVVFRGLLDTHLHNEPGKLNIGSLFFISVLWGWWHLPIAPPQTPVAVLIFLLPLTHCLAGIPLSVFWRRSGNLAVPGFTHAFIDAVRNGMLR